MGGSDVRFHSFYYIKERFEFSQIDPLIGLINRANIVRFYIIDYQYMMASVVFYAEMKVREILSSFAGFLIREPRLDFQSN